MSKGGGNVLGMDRIEGDSLQWLLVDDIETMEQEKILHARCLQFRTEMTEYDSIKYERK